MKKIILILVLAFVSSVALATEPPELGNHRKTFDDYAGKYFEKIQEALEQAGTGSKCGTLARLSGLTHALAIGASKESSMSLKLYDYSEYVDHKAVDPRKYILAYSLGIDGLSQVQVVFYSNKDISSISELEFNVYLAEGRKGTAINKDLVPTEVVELEWIHSQTICRLD